MDQKNVYLYNPAFDKMPTQMGSVSRENKVS